MTVIVSYLPSNPLIGMAGLVPAIHGLFGQARPSPRESHLDPGVATH